MTNTITFRPLTEADLVLMHRWLNTDFVIEWWEGRGHSYEEIVEDFQPRPDESEQRFIIQADGTPIGYIQLYQMADEPEAVNCWQADVNAVGIDLFIGEAAYIHRRLGSVIIGQFLRDVVFSADGVQSCLIDPEPTNRIAIRAYEKAGFRYLKTVECPGQPIAYLMDIHRADVFFAP